MNPPHEAWPLLSRDAGADPGRAAGRTLRRTHRPAPAASGRAAAVGARLRRAPRRQRGHRGRRLRPAAGAGPGGGARRSAASSCASDGRAQPARHGSAAGAAAPVDATALIRGMFHAGVHGSAPGMGTLPEDWLDPALLQRALRRVGRGDGRGLGALRRARPATRRCARPCRAGWPTWASTPSRRRSSPPWAPRMRWTWSRARCCSRATRCWSTSPAGRSSTSA